MTAADLSPSVEERSLLSCHTGRAPSPRGVQLDSRLLHPTVERRRQAEKDKVVVRPQQQALASYTRRLGAVPLRRLYAAPSGWLDAMIGDGSSGGQCKEAASRFAWRHWEPAGACHGKRGLAEE